MDFETLAGIYTYAMDHHTGQWSRLYRLLGKIRMNAPDHVYHAIQGNRHAKRERVEEQTKLYGRKRALSYTLSEWEEWERARSVYRKLKRRQAQ